MMNRRPYIAQSEIAPGSAVIQGTVDNAVTAPADEKADMLGVYPFEANEAAAAQDRIGIVLGGVVKVIAGGTASAGKKAVLSKTKLGAFEDVPATAGTYKTCGIFLESGEAGEYIDMYIERGVITVA
ncbi:hypothetical protein ACFGOO_03100 [Treponema vincentii]|uniref:structural cement protein Gp24 n=1 Tax=Treponema vincentii TaxID=69710 RepID=UPI0035F5E7AA